MRLLMQLSKTQIEIKKTIIAIDRFTYIAGIIKSISIIEPLILLELHNWLSESLTIEFYMI